MQCRCCYESRLQFVLNVHIAATYEGLAPKQQVKVTHPNMPDALEELAKKIVFIAENVKKQTSRTKNVKSQQKQEESAKQRCSMTIVDLTYVMISYSLMFLSKHQQRTKL